MASTQLEALRQLLNGTQKARDEMGEGATMILSAILDKHEKVEKDKERIKNDIKRGSRLSKGRIPG